MEISGSAPSWRYAPSCCRDMNYIPHDMATSGGWEQKTRAIIPEIRKGVANDRPHWVHLIWYPASVYAAPAGNSTLPNWSPCHFPWAPYRLRYSDTIILVGNKNTLSITPSASLDDTGTSHFSPGRHFRCWGPFSWPSSLSGAISHGTDHSPLCRALTESPLDTSKCQRRLQKNGKSMRWVESIWGHIGRWGRGIKCITGQGHDHTQAHVFLYPTDCPQRG